MALPDRGCGTDTETHQSFHRVTNQLRSGSGLESHATVGNSPVREMYADSES